MRHMKLPVFVCEMLHLRLSERACGAIYKKGENPVCRRCPIGAAHARGERPSSWPDARPVVRIEVERFDRIPPRVRRRRATILPPPSST